MGNCQAIDNASLLIQHPSGRVDKLYFPVTADHIMRLKPGHYVALLLTTTLYSSTAAAPTAAAAAATTTTNSGAPLRVTRIKLLRPTDTLQLGHVYRLVSSPEVKKGMLAKKQCQAQKDGRAAEQSSYIEAIVGRPDVKNTNQQVKHERNRSRNDTGSCSSRTTTTSNWQPALNSISEALN